MSYIKKILYILRLLINRFPIIIYDTYFKYKNSRHNSTRIILYKRKPEEKEKRDKRVINLQNKGYTQNQIAEIENIDVRTVRRIKRKNNDENKK